MTETSEPTPAAPVQLLYRDLFGELTDEGDRLIWRGSDEWWDDDYDEKRWRKLGDVTHLAIARVQKMHHPASMITLEFERPRGQSLSALLDPPPGAHTLDPTTSLAMLVQLASALEVMHNNELFGVCLTPAHIFIHPDTADLALTLIPILAPISAAKLHPEDFLRAGEPVHALAYIAQERLRATGITPAIDVYALGVLGYQLLAPTPLPTFNDPAELIHAIVAGRWQNQIALQEHDNTFEILRQCLTRRPRGRLTTAEARAGLAGALRLELSQPCERANQQRETGDFSAALETLTVAMKDPVQDRNPRLHLMHAIILAQSQPADPLAVIAAARAAVERIERWFDERQMTAPIDRYFTTQLFATPADAQIVARQIYTLLGAIYRQENLLQKAIEQFDRALQIAEDDGQLLLQYAATLRLAKRPGEALRALERAEKVGVTDYHVLHLEKARAMEHQGMLDQAIEAYTRAVKIKEDGDIWTHLGKLYIVKGADARPKAKHAFEQAVKCDPHQIEAATNLADLALEQDDEDSALTALDSVRMPSDMRQLSEAVLDNYLALTNTLTRRVEERLRQNQQDPVVHRRLGDLYLIRGHLIDDPADPRRYDLANDDYVRALLSFAVSIRLQPEQPELLEKIRDVQAPLLEEQAKLERQITKGDTTPATYNRLAWIDWRLATIALKLDSRRSAIALLKRAVEVLDLALQQDLSQRDTRRLFADLAERLRFIEGGG